MLEEFMVEDRGVQWLVGEEVSERRMEYSPGTYLESDGSGRLRRSTPEHLPVAEALDDVQSGHGFRGHLRVGEGIYAAVGRGFSAVRRWESVAGEGQFKTRSRSRAVQ